MKKIFKYILPICVCIFLSSCGHKIKRCSGVVTYILNDTMKMKVGNKDAIFFIKGVDYDGGVVVVNDSAEITYVGSNLNGRAVLIRLIPPKSHIIDIKKDTTKELMTSPASPERIKKFKKFIKDGK